MKTIKVLTVVLMAALAANVAPRRELPTPPNPAATSALSGALAN